MLGASAKQGRERAAGGHVRQVWRVGSQVPGLLSMLFTWSYVIIGRGTDLCQMSYRLLQPCSLHAQDPR